MKKSIGIFVAIAVAGLAIYMLVHGPNPEKEVDLILARMPYDHEFPEREWSRINNLFVNDREKLDDRLVAALTARAASGGDLRTRYQAVDLHNYLEAGICARLHPEGESSQNHRRCVSADQRSLTLLRDTDFEAVAAILQTRSLESYQSVVWTAAPLLAADPALALDLAGRALTQTENFFHGLENKVALPLMSDPLIRGGSLELFLAMMKLGRKKNPPSELVEAFAYVGLGRLEGDWPARIDQALAAAGQPEAAGGFLKSSGDRPPTLADLSAEPKILIVRGSEYQPPRLDGLLMFDLPVRSLPATPEAADLLILVDDRLAAADGSQRRPVPSPDLADPEPSPDRVEPWAIYALDHGRIAGCLFGPEETFTLSDFLLGHPGRDR